MANVTFIPARPQLGNNVKQAEKPKLRVAAYCRVSTDSDEQATSYEAQIEHYTKFIEANSEWTLAGIYADDGISGTNTKKREEFNKMIDECEAGNIDMIITKSISRFARNTLDCLKYIRRLKDKNIPVFFEKENINSMDSKGEVLLTIMASLAQQESQSLSQNVKMGIQYRYQQGKVIINAKRFLGYTKDADGNLIIEPKEAEVVKRIFREYLEGFSSNKIAKGLMDDGILNGAGNAKWHTSNITSILRNEKYMGDALLQKTITTDYLTKTRVKNKGAAPQYYVEDNHEAIIPKDLFMLVQQELINRRLVKTDSAGKKRVYSGSHILSQKVICGGCGVAFRRIHWNNRGCRSIVWRCISRLENTGIACKARTVNELLLQDIIVEAINKLLSDKTSYLGVLQENIATVVKASSAVSESDIDAKLLALQKELLKKANNKDDYDALAEEIFELRELKHKSELEGVTRDDHIKRIAELQDFIKAQPTTLTEYDENLVNRLLQKITVFDNHFVVEFKSGVSVEIDG